MMLASLPPSPNKLALRDNKLEIAVRAIAATNLLIMLIMLAVLDFVCTRKLDSASFEIFIMH